MEKSVLRKTVDVVIVQKEEAKESTYNINLIVNKNLTSVIADSGAKISVYNTSQANKWNLLSRMVPSKVKIKPYNSTPTPVHREARHAVSLGKSAVPAVWHIISGSCQPVLSGSTKTGYYTIQLYTRNLPNNIND